MSGPKVVRVVTREERIATCEGLLARLESALQEWERAARRSGTLADAEVEAMRARHEELKRALAADRFDEVQRAAPTEVQFVQREQERRHTEAVSKETRKRRMRRRTRAIEAAMRAAPAKTPTQAGVTEEQRALALKLKEADDDQSLEQWLAQHPSPADAETAQIERQLAELSFLLDTQVVAGLEVKLGIAEREVSAPRRALLLDSLTIELANLVKQARDREAVRARLYALAEELRSIESAGAVERAASVLTAMDDDLQALAALEADTVKALEAERESLAARARRSAVLKGLATLGYQVNEGLETAWVSSGRVVVKRPTQPGYGVELGGKTENGRLQVRVVVLRGASDAVDSSRDKDAERMWCSDFSKLQEQIAAAGGGLVIERALAVGATPLKLVEDAEAGTSSADRLATPRERVLPHP